MAEYLDEIPTAKAVSLHDIYRVIAGHSYYHGDRILAALTCIVEGKEGNPVRPADVAPVVHGRWIPHDRVFGDDFLVCSKCQFVSEDRSTRRYYHYCPHCGAKMDGGADHAAD